MAYHGQMTNLDPTTLSPRQLEELGPHDVHQLALRASRLAQAQALRRLGSPALPLTATVGIATKPEDDCI